jgi:hypothetical protein
MSGCFFSFLRALGLGSLKTKKRTKSNDALNTLSQKSIFSDLYSASSIAVSHTRARSGYILPPGASQRSLAASTLSSIDSYMRA